MSLQLTFSNLETIDSLKARLEQIKRAFATAGCQLLKTTDLVNKLFNIAESHLIQQATIEVTHNLLPS